MADVHEPEVRSYNMSQIKGKNTKPEILVRKFLFAKGLRFRLHEKRLAGKPDLVLPKYKTVVFVNGCFWHMHKDCKYFVIPKTRTEWWVDKLHSNVQRDKIRKKELMSMGWNVIIVWECQLKGEKKDYTLKNLYKNICQT